jgi:SAM-dependent methyltransferase
MANWSAKVICCRPFDEAGHTCAPKGHSHFSQAHKFQEPRSHASEQECPSRSNIPFCINGYDKSLFLNLEARQWDEQAIRYDVPRIRDPIYMAGIEAAVRALAPQEGDRILDAACGTGLTIIKYVNPSVRIVAVDLSIESLKQLRHRAVITPAVECLQADLTTLPFATNSFDKVLCANAIQHMPGRELRQQAIRELSRVVRPGGKVVVTVHNYSRPKRHAGWKKEGPCNGSSGSVHYIYRHERPEFEALLAGSLQIESVNGAGLPLPYKWKLSPLARKLERILSRFSASADWGHMLVGVGRKLK